MQSSPWLASITVLAVLCGLRMCEGMSTAAFSSPPSTPPSATSATTSSQGTTVASTTSTPQSSNQTPRSTMTTTSARGTNTGPTMTLSTREATTGPMTSTASSETTTEPVSSSIAGGTTDDRIATLAPGTVPTLEPTTPGSNISVSTTEEIITSTPLSTTPTTTTPTTTTPTTEATTTRQSHLQEKCDSDTECRTERSTCLKGRCRCDRNYYPSAFEGNGYLRCLPVAELSPHEFRVEVESTSIKLKWRHSEFWSYIRERACYEVEIREAESLAVVNQGCVTSQSHEFLNLQYSTKYILGLRVLVIEGGEYKYTIKETRPATIGRNSGALASLIVLAIIMIIISVVFVVCCCCFRETLWEYLGQLKCLQWLLGTSGGRAEAVQLQRVCTLPTSRPLQLTSLKDSVHNMHKDSDRLFLCIFDELKQSSPTLEFTAATSAANTTKNRYNDVVPYDNSRVKLPVSNEGDSDYINASYIPGFRGDRQFIAAQGPLEDTVVDFWRMVWNERSPIIVMLTQLNEKRGVKCHLYWPVEQETSMTSGEITIENISTTNHGHFSLSIFRLKKGEETQTVKHFNCPEWPDHGSIGPEILVQLVQSVQDYSTPEMPPIIVHCSAGVGRTGTYIAVDYVMNYIRENGLQDRIDIYSFVLKMRRYRPLMVQTYDQYALIHDCAVLVVEERKRQEEENQSEAGASKASQQDLISLDDGAIPQSDTVRLIDEVDGASKSDKKAAEMPNGAVQKRSSYTNQALAEDEAAASVPAKEDAGSTTPDQSQSQECKESKADRNSKSGSLQDGDKSVSAEDAASFHTVDLHSQEGSKDDVTEDSKDTVTEDSKDTVTEDSKNTVTEDSKDTMTEDSKDTMTEDSKDTVTDSGVDDQAQSDNEAGGEA